MSDMISRQLLDLWNRYKPTIAVDAIEYDRELKKLLGTNLASLGTDGISRRQAIDALRTCYDTETISMDNGDEYINYGDAVGEIEQLPPIHPEPHWIPVTERLPKDGRQVLVYAMSVHYALAKYDEMRDADGTYKKQWVTFDAWKPYYTIKDVIAWMPLPEPAKLEND